VEGFSGCNAFTARYVQDSVGSRFIAMGRLEVGRRDCDQAARAAEARVLGVLQGVSSYTITVDTMIMSGSSGSLTFVALSSPQPATAGAPMTTGSLENTRWIGAMPAGGSAQTTPRLELGEGGKVAGFTGCNVLSGQWHEEGDAVVLTSIAVTKRFCVDAAGEAEKVFLAAVGEGSKVTRAGAGVVVTSPTGIKLSLTAAAAA
jgi:heat shock protein HslJ